MFAFDATVYDTVSGRTGRLASPVQRPPVVSAGPTGEEFRSRPARRRWTNDEVADLLNAYALGTSADEIAAQLGRTKRAIWLKASRLGARRPIKLPHVEFPTTDRRPDFYIERRANGRIIWSNAPVQLVAELWKKGFSHKVIADLASCSPASIRSVANTRGMACRSGYILRKTYAADATDLPGIADQMVGQHCARTGQLFFVRRCDKASARLSPVFKKTKEYQQSHDD